MGSMSGTSVSYSGRRRQSVLGDHLWRDSLDEMLEASVHGLHPLMERADLARLLPQMNAL